MIFNGAIIFSGMLSKSIGIAYSPSAEILFVLYAVGENILSILLIPLSTFWYIFWEAIIFATFIVIFSIIVVFSKSSAEDTARVEKEEADKTSILIHLLEIEGILTAKDNQEAALPCLNSFKALKERIQDSTPFRRISGNSSVLEIANKIKNNLVSLKAGFQGNLTDKALWELQRLLEDTRRLVINRETLNIK